MVSSLTRTCSNRIIFNSATNRFSSRSRSPGLPRCEFPLDFPDAGIRFTEIHGGIVQGLGQAMFERIVYDEAGQVQTTTLMDYSIPDARSVPSFTTDHRVTPSPANHLGVKGVGEAGTIGAPPAIVAAVRAAVRAAVPEVASFDLELPLLPERVWRAVSRRSGA